MKIEIIRGTTMSFLLTIKDSDGNTYTLKSGDKLIFGVKLEPDKGDYLIKRILTESDAQDDSYPISLEPEDTSELEFKDYRYDIGLQTSDGAYYMLVSCSPFVVNKAVTAKE